MSEVTRAIDTPRGVLLGTVRVTLRTGGLAATHLINAATTGQIRRTAPARRARIVSLPMRAWSLCMEVTHTVGQSTLETRRRNVIANRYNGGLNVSEAPKSEFLSGMIAVFDRDDLDKHDKLIAVYLIRRGALWGKASVFQGTIAKETGVSVATVKRSLNRMQEIGVLKVDRSVGQRSKYTLVLDANPAQGELGVAQCELPKQEFAQLTQSEGVAQGELGVAQGELGGSSHRARVPKYKAKYKVKAKEKGNSRADPSEDDALSAMHKDADPAEALVRMYNMLDPPDSSNYQRFTVARYQQMQAALDAGATYEIVAQVIQEMAATAKGPWEVRKEAVRRARGELTGDAGEITAGATRENRKSDRYRGFFSQVF